MFLIEMHSFNFRIITSLCIFWASKVFQEQKVYIFFERKVRNVHDYDWRWTKASGCKIESKNILTLEMEHKYLNLLGLLSWDRPFFSHFSIEGRHFCVLSHIPIYLCPPPIMIKIYEHLKFIWIGQSCEILHNVGEMSLALWVSLVMRAKWAK